MYFNPLETFTCMKYRKYLFFELILFTGYMMYLEMILRLAIDNTKISLFSSYGFFASLLFSISVSFFIIAILFLIPIEYHIAPNLIWLTSLALMYGSQIIYHDIFGTFYKFQPIQNNETNITQTFSGALVQNSIWIIIISIPIFIYIFGGKKKRNDYKLNKITPKTKKRFVTMSIIMSTLVHFFGLALVQINENAHETYTKNSELNLSVEYFGLFTAMRIDLKHCLAGQLASNRPETEEDDKNANIGMQKQGKDD